MQFFWNTSSYKNNTAVISQSGEVLSYEELFTKADVFAEQLKKRSLIFICAGNNTPSLTAYIACLRHQHVCLLLNKEIDDGMLQTLVDMYQPEYIYKPGESVEYQLTETGFCHSDLLNEELAVLLSTSGSTGSPKLVRLSQRNIQSNAASIAEYLRLDESERPVTNLPFYYSYGLSVINSHLYAGATLLLTDDSIINPAFWKFCDTHGFTSMAGVPYTYDMLDAVGFRKRSCPTLRYMTQAGGRMDPVKVSTYAQWANEQNLRFYVMYGQTEATARMSYLPSELALNHPDSIGIAIPGGQFSIDSATNELVYYGDNVSMGYAENRSDLSLGNTNNGILKTGDVARVDTNGLYYITGRMKRFLKIAGNRFGLDELDAIFSRMGIEAVCGGTDGKLIVAITDETQKDSVAGYLKNTWHMMKNQYRIKIVPCIPRSSTGKVLYAELFS